MENHGGSPPNLGFKEATLKLGETRLNQDTFKKHHKTRTNMNSTSLQHNHNPNQGLHNDSQMESYTLGEGGLSKEEISISSYIIISYNYNIFNKPSKKHMPSRLSIFTCLNKAIHTFSFYISSLISPIEQQKGIWLSMEPILHEIYPLTKRRIYQLQCKAQLTPSPQGFSSLPRVSEAFTPKTIFNPQQQNQETKSNASKSNMLIYMHNNYYM